VIAWSLLKLWASQLWGCAALSSFGGGALRCPVPRWFLILNIVRSGFHCLRSIVFPLQVGGCAKREILIA